MASCSCSPSRRHAEGCRIPVLSWLSRLQPDDDVPLTPVLSPALSPALPSKKRPRSMDGSDRGVFALPTPSTPRRREESPSKRKRGNNDVLVNDDVFIDADATPRPPISMPPPPSPALRGRSSPTKSSGRSSQTKSSAMPSSTASSPVRNFAMLAQGDIPILLRSFTQNASEMPEGLMKMYNAIDKYSRGLRVVSPDERDNIAKMDVYFRSAFGDEVFDSKPDPKSDSKTNSDRKRDTFGPTPSPEAVKLIVKRAAKCHMKGSDEAGWYTLVHSHLLLLAFENELYDNFVDFVPCSTATIKPTSLRPLGPGGLRFSKMIDCAIVVDPVESVLDIIRRRLASSSFHSINHSEHASLVERPISVSMEVKRTGVDFDRALIQCGVWVTAHFSRLRKLVEDVRDEHILEQQEQQLQSLQTPPPPHQVPQLPQRIGEMSLGAPPSAPSLTDEGDRVANTPGSIVAGDASFSSTPAAPSSSATDHSVHDAAVDRNANAATMYPFLPLIIVQGHDWHFLAASQSKTGATLLWSKEPFGSTTSWLGCYQIVATLQYLAHWTRNTYAPWFRKNALGIKEERASRRATGDGEAS